MRRQEILFILLVVFLPQHIKAQPNLWKFIQADSAHTIIRPLNINNKLFTIPEELKCEPSRHHYIIKNHQLYLQVDGSGKIYQIDSANAVPRRIDKTCYEGYNFYAYNFQWNDTLYSLSGWGFWKYDGGLRYFDESRKEWFIIPLNKKVLFAESLNAHVWHDAFQNKIYVLYWMDEDSYIQKHLNQEDSLYVQCFDLQKMEWWESPKVFLAKSPKTNLKTIGKIIHTPIGLLIESTKGIQIFDFTHNKIYQLSDKKAAALYSVMNQNYDGFYIQRKERSYIYSPKLDSLFPISITRADLASTWMTMYENKNQDKMLQVPKEITTFAFFILLSFTIYLFILNRKLRKLRTTKTIKYLEKDASNVNQSVGFEFNLTPQELAVFRLLVDNSLQEKSTSINEINRVLGTKNKEIAIQKNIRSEVLKSLNERFQVYSSTSDSLVERERADFDKRIYLYKINPAYLFKFKTKNVKS
jgi:hypothetical protein